MSSDSETDFFFVKPPEMAIGRVLLSPDGPQPYKVVFRLGDRVLAEHPVPSIREGEALIRSELPGIQFSAIEERPHPRAPERRLSSVQSDGATD